jgi:trehalose-6-phosphate synthase
MRLAERLSFFAACDILMITATRDGLNRYPMEFTLAKQNLSQMYGDRFKDPSIPQFDKGLIIISEFISSARVMRGAMTGDFHLKCIYLCF